MGLYRADTDDNSQQGVDTKRATFPSQLHFGAILTSTPAAARTARTARTAASMVDTRRKPAAALAQADAFIPTPTPSKTAAKSKSKSKSIPAAATTATAN
ncbi:hypothetical protein CF335_g363 [Tilletia laevis]|nr:hypothetical protein CF335_g363 [Tilletia laevis]